MLSQVGFIEAGFWRYVFGVGFLILAQAISKKRIPCKAITQQFKGIFLVGIIGLFGFNVFFFLGLVYTSALNAALIVSLNPVFTLFLSYLILGERINFLQKTGSFIALIGVAYLLAHGNVQNLVNIQWQKGDVLILAANLVFAMHHVWVKKYRGELDNRIFTLLTNALCLMGFVICMPFVGMKALAVVDIYFWGAAVGIGVLGTGLAYLLWNAGIKILGAGKAGLYMNIVPLAAAIFSVAVGESLANYHWISGAIIIFGMVIFNRK